MPPLKKIIKNAIAIHDEHHRARRAGAGKDDAKRDAKEQLKSLIGCGKRMRATDAADKELRRGSILDAAESLFKKTLEYANVAEVAQEAGLAKGTVYLYFQTKEEMYLALHMRNAEGFFTELIADLESGYPHGQKKSINFDHMRALVVKHMLDNETYFPLVACCVGLPQDSVPAESALATKQLLTSWLLRSGVGLERHFAQLAPGEGVRLLNHSYALMIGLYHLLGDHNHAPQRPDGLGMSSFRDEALVALDRYWRATIGESNSQ
jgi:AcrR family transcriptional regulator